MGSGSEPLTEKEAKAAIDRIRETHERFYGDRLGQGALRIFQQAFPHRWVYIAELLQNAVDEHARRIRFDTSRPGSLVFEHNGNAFQERDVEGLCSSGNSYKGAATVGFMGIGFKAVFRRFELVRVSSGAWRFRLEVPVEVGEEYQDRQRKWIGSVLPHWDDIGRAPSMGMECRFEFSASIDETGNTDLDIAKVLGEDRAFLAMLARRGVRSVEWNEKRWELSESITGDLSEGPIRVEVTAKDESAGQTRWMVLASSYQPSSKAIREFLEHRGIEPSPTERERTYEEARRPRLVELFVPIDEKGRPIPPNRGMVYALLPIDSAIPLGLHVQADWLLDVTRRELMDFSESAWHSEILERVPVLVEDYFEWLVELQTSLGEAWVQGYDALPHVPENGSVDQGQGWFWSESFRNELARRLKVLSFLPVRGAVGGAPEFVSGEAGSVLPSPLELVFKDPDLGCASLFRSRIINYSLLSDRAKHSLEALGLLHELSAENLEEEWGQSAVPEWIQRFPESYQEDSLAALIGALGEMDSYGDWKKAKLVCLRTESGSWTHRFILTRLPPDWDSLAGEDEIKNALLPVVGKLERILSWSLTSKLRRSNGDSFVQQCPEAELASIVQRWWKSLPVGTHTPVQTDLVLKLTNWVRSKQPYRKDLVRRVLCEGGDVPLSIAPIDNAIVTAPYAGEFRSRFYPGRLRVSGLYATSAEDVPTSQWLSFFETLRPSIRGRFYLHSTLGRVSWEEAHALVGKDETLPALRGSPITLSWHGHRVEVGRYSLGDFSLPKPALVLLNGTTFSKDDAHDFAAWMDEVRDIFLARATKSLVYIPERRSVVLESKLVEPAAWISQLGQLQWVFARDGSGPYLPRDVLLEDDPTRPLAPVARLPDGLSDVLKGAGLSFGEAIPAAPACDRLKIRGPHSSPEVLGELAGEALAEVENNPEKASYLSAILSDTALFPLPGGKLFIDGSIRVPLTRVVRSSSQRGTLGGWCVAIEDMESGSAERQALEMVSQSSVIPQSVSLSHTLDFLEWVWRSGPPSELVRRVLSRALRYVADDLDAGRDSSNRWETLRGTAKVFVKNEQQWVAVKGNERLFLDDLQAELPHQVTEGFQLVSPGHLGETEGERKRSALLIGITPLSSRFRISVESGQEDPLPGAWQDRFQQIHVWLEGEVSTQSDEDSGVEEQPAPTTRLPSVSLSRYVSLGFTLREGDTALTPPRDVFAANMGGSIGVRGSPTEFAVPLALILMGQWKLERRPKLLLALAARLMKLDVESPTGVREGAEGSSPDATEHEIEPPVVAPPSSASERREQLEPNPPIKGPSEPVTAAGESSATVSVSEQEAGEQVPPGEASESYRKTRWAQRRNLRKSHRQSPVEAVSPSKSEWKYGSGGESSEHLALKNLVAKNPALLSSVADGLELVDIEFRFDSGDRADILFADLQNVPVAVEIEPRAGDLNIGAWQAAKYRHLAAQNAGLPCDVAKGVLVAPSIPADIRAKCKDLGVSWVEVTSPA